MSESISSESDIPAGRAPNTGRPEAADDGGGHTDSDIRRGLSLAGDDALHKGQQVTAGVR